MKLFEELRRRNVFRVGIAYVALAWVLLQITDVIAPILVLPDWVARAVFFLLAIGFPVVLFLAWAFELTPDGIKREKDVDRRDSGSTSTGPWTSRLIIGSLAMAVVLLLADLELFPRRVEAPVDALGQSDDTDHLQLRTRLGGLGLVVGDTDPVAVGPGPGVTQQVLTQRHDKVGGVGRVKR